MAFIGNVHSSGLFGSLVDWRIIHFTAQFPTVRFTSSSGVQSIASLSLSRVEEDRGVFFIGRSSMRKDTPAAEAIRMSIRTNNRFQIIERCHDQRRCKPALQTENYDLNMQNYWVHVVCCVNAERDWKPPGFWGGSDGGNWGAAMR